LTADELRAQIAALEHELLAACARYVKVTGEPLTSFTPILAPVPVFSVSADDLILATNSAGERLLGTLCPGSQGFSSLFHPNSVASLHKRLGVRWEGAREYVATLSNGHTADITVDVRAEGEERNYLFCVQDRNLQHQMFEVEQDRSRARSMTDFARSVARDLNDPMAIVTGRLELLLQLDPSTREPEFLERSLRTALAHARSVSAALHNFRLIGRSPEREYERVCLAAVIAEACELLGKRGLDITVRFLDDQTDRVIGGDAAIYSRVLADLFRICIVSRYTGNEIGIHYELGLKEVQVSVAPYLSLAAYKNGAKSTIIANSEGCFQGAEVVLTLLQSVGAVLETRELGATRVFTLRTPLPPLQRVRAKVTKQRLLVVGREGLAKTIKTLVGRDGYEVAGVCSAGAALEHTDGQSGFDYVVTELVLPDMSGLDLADALLSARVPLTSRPIVISPQQDLHLPESVQVLHFPISRHTLLTALGENPRSLRSLR
jgi:hypothetical protein